MEAGLFVVDLARCTGCFACSVACKDRADLADTVDWLQVETREAGHYPRPMLTFRVIHCFHCADPVCAEPCPTQAIQQTPEGWVQIVREACIGCGACAARCPFGAIAMDHTGLAGKCDGCIDEMAKGWQPTCVRACPMRALDYHPVQAAPERFRRRPEADWNDKGIGPRVRYLVLADDQEVAEGE